MTRILVDATLVCLECVDFDKSGQVVVEGGRKSLSPLTTEGLLCDGILHGCSTGHMRFNLTAYGETNVAVLDYGQGMSAIPPIVLPEGSTTKS